MTNAVAIQIYIDGGSAIARIGVERNGDRGATRAHFVVGRAVLVHLRPKAEGGTVGGIARAGAKLKLEFGDETLDSCPSIKVIG